MVLSRYQHLGDRSAAAARARRDSGQGVLGLDADVFEDHPDVAAPRERLWGGYDGFVWAPIS
jgi:hypothetical protein